MRPSEAFDILIEMLSDSDESDWSAWSQGEVSKKLSWLMREGILTVQEKQDLRVLLAPTGPIQEIALANDWHDEYIRCASALDDHAA